jgi:trehalose-6-phosphate synthase
VPEDRCSVWVAANRLPVTWDARSGWLRGPGGLVTALDAVVRSRTVGWVGAAPALGTDDLRPPRWEHGPLVPVRLDPHVSDGAVTVICNGALWPALHGLPEWVDWRAARWGDYVEQNRVFAEALIELTRTTDTIWVHDYHLLLVPRFLAERRPRSSIVLSIHTPIDDKSFAELPEAEALTTGISQAGIVGVQTRDDANALGRLFDRFAIRTPRPELRVAPVSVDVDALVRRANDPACRAIGQRITSGQAHRRLVVGIDRLD